MSSLKVTVEKLTVFPHSNADALELAEVGLYRAVVMKGRYRTGDLAVYIPEQAILPAALVEELGLTGKLAGKAKNRVKAVRLRGELSQGIVCVPALLDGADLGSLVGQDLADMLGITKWVPEVPVHMSGEVEAAPDLLPWVDIENLKRYPDVFAPGEPVVGTEKVHGTCCVLTWSPGGVQVASKGFADRKLALKETVGNLYWDTVKAYDLPRIAEWVSDAVGAQKVGLYGEVFGAGVQDLTYGASAKAGLPGYLLFDIQVEVDGQTRWLNHGQVRALADLFSIPVVPVLYQGPFDLAEILPVVDGAETVTGAGIHLREGIVLRPAVERFSPVLGGRAIAKLVSGDYLTRSGGTEYQ